jgi:hypothetical protein
VTKDGEKIETKDFNHTYFQNIEARLKKAGFGWTSLLQEDLHVSSIGYDLG